MITQKRLKEIFHYDATTGFFTRILKTGGNTKVGHIPNKVNSHGYIRIYIDKKRYTAHNLAWLYVYGVYPDWEIDHINHIGHDNRIVNLREVSHKENMKNQKKRKTNTSGQAGVSWHKKRKRWNASICIEYKTIHLGTFVQFHEAVNARKNAEVLYGFHKNHGGE